MISVVIPAYNAVAILPHCLCALLDQSVPRDRYEVIVVDDGSTDDTQSVARRLGARVVAQARGGPARARNEGCRVSRGEYVAFLDSDCVPIHEWIEEITKPLVEQDEVVAVKGAYRTRQRSICARFVQLEFEDRYELLARDRYIDFVDTGSAAFRRSVLLELGGFDASFPMASNEDTELSYRISEQGHKMVFNPRAIVFHSHPDRWTRYLRVKFWRARYRMDAYRRHPKKALKDSYTPQVLKLQIGLIGLVGLSLMGAIALPWLLYLSALLAASLVATTLPFVAWAWKRDRVVALASPAFLLGRAAVFAAGVTLAFAVTALKRFRSQPEHRARVGH